MSLIYSLQFFLIAFGTSAEPPDKGTFPELRPILKAPKGYSLAFKDGPDFYTWVLAEDKKQGKRHQSGIGIYFGHHPNLDRIDKKTAKQVKGKICSQEVNWWVEVSDDPNDPWIRRDAVITYEHGKGFKAIQLHIWVWGSTEEQVADLVKKVEALKFEARDK